MEKINEIIRYQWKKFSANYTLNFMKLIRKTKNILDPRQCDNIHKHSEYNKRYKNTLELTKLIQTQ